MKVSLLFHLLSKLPPEKGRPQDYFWNDKWVHYAFEQWERQDTPSYSDFLNSTLPEVLSPEGPFFSFNPFINVPKTKKKKVAQVLYQYASVDRELLINYGLVDASKPQKVLEGKLPEELLDRALAAWETNPGSGSNAVPAVVDPQVQHESSWSPVDYETLFSYPDQPALSLENHLALPGPESPLEPPLFYTYFLSLSVSLLVIFGLYFLKNGLYLKAWFGLYGISSIISSYFLYLVRFYSSNGTRFLSIVRSYLSNGTQFISVNSIIYKVRMRASLALLTKRALAASRVVSVRFSWCSLSFCLPRRRVYEAAARQRERREGMWASFTFFCG